MKRILPLLLIIFWSGSICVSGPVSIKGHVKGANGLSIRLISYTDQVSMMKKTLAATMIDAKGNFEMQADIPQTTYAYLEAEFESADIFLQPGGEYELNLSFKPLAEGSGYYNRENMGITFLKDKPDSLNIYIRDVNALYNDFILNNFDTRNRSKAKANLLEFKNELSLKTHHSQNSYLKNYILYKIASIEESLRLKSSASLAREYLSNKPVLLENIEYMDFFSKFFEKILITNNKNFSYSETYDLVEGNAGLNSFLNYLKKDSLISGEELRELVLLSSLKDLYYNGGFNRERIINITNQLEKQSKFIRIKNIAFNLDKRFERLRKGSPAPDFKLADINNKEYSLNDFHGKYLYIDFFDARNAIGVSELKQMKELYPKYKSEIAFVSICVNNSEEDLVKFLETNNYPWPVLWFGNNYPLLDEYNISTFPFYILIDKQGKIDRYPAPSPSENLEEVLESIKTK